MKAKLLILLLLMIVLVSLNWFRTVVAQDLSSLEKLDKQQLLKKYRDSLADRKESEYYRSPQIFDSDKNRSQHIPGDSLKGGMSLSGRDAVLDSISANDSGLMVAADQIQDFDQLRPFGMELFDAPPDYEPPADIASAADYMLGPGDNLIIYLWGRVEKEYNLTLDREGKVFIPRVGEIIGWGLTLQQFQQRVKKLFSKAYSEFDLTISLGKIRSIRIYVTGEVKKPGAYSVSSLTSLFNAIYLAGGPNQRGSMRHIKLMRRGKVQAEVDLYNLLLAGDNSTDARLQTGDVVFVPVAGDRVAVRGEINRSAIYELKGDETALTLLSLAGNPTAQAHLNRVMLERITADGEREVRDLNLNREDSSQTDDILLLDGDRLTVFSIFDVTTNRVAVAGCVKHPGYYERNDSTRVSDLVRQGQLQPYDVYFERADLYRYYPDRRAEVTPINLHKILSGPPDSDILLQDRDSLHIYAINEVQRDKRVYIEGEIKTPGPYPLYDMMTVQDIIFLAGSFTRGAVRHEAEIARIDSIGNVTMIFADLDSPNSPPTILREDDHVYIRQIPQWHLHQAVTIEGEVNYPGGYTLAGKDETLYQLLLRAGGFTPNAFPRGIVFERQSIQHHLQRLKVPDLLERSRPVTEDSLGNIVKHNISRYDLASMNRVIIDLEKIVDSDGREGDLVLKPGDHIYVPSVPTGISVMGAVGANGTIKFKSNKKVKHYIQWAGNFTRQADKKEVRLMRAGGEVISGRGCLGKKVYLGDVIIVPTKIEKERNWLKTVTTALTATTGVLTSIYIVSKL
ncbi:MAG: SLBB domain-containing protein [bacterium]